jgi:hypothetical protein
MPKNNDCDVDLSTPDLANDNKTDFVEVGSKVVYDINYKLVMLMFVFGLIIFSDTFVTILLQPIDGLVNDEQPTSKGTIVQLLVFCLVLLVLDLLIKWDCV